MRQFYADEIMKLETIKANKLKDLLNHGIDQQYLVELSKKKIEL